MHRVRTRNGTFYGKGACLPPGAACAAVLAIIYLKTAVSAQPDNLPNDPERVQFIPANFDVGVVRVI